MKGEAHSGKTLPHIRPGAQSKHLRRKERRMWALYLREARESNYQLKRSRKQFAFQIGRFLDQEMER